MMNKIIKKLIPINTDGYAFYILLGFFCSALMEINSLLPYYIQLDIFYSTEISFLTYKPASFILFIEYALAIFSYFLINSKYGKYFINALNDLHTRIEQLCSPAFFIMAGTVLLCATTGFIGDIFGSGEYYKKYAVNFSFLAIVFLAMIALSNLFIKIPHFLKSKPQFKEIAVIILVAFFITPFINNGKEEITLKIDKSKYYEIKEKTKTKPEIYIENIIKNLKLD